MCFYSVVRNESFYTYWQGKMCVPSRVWFQNEV